MNHQTFRLIARLGAVVNTDLLDIEPAHQDRGTTLEDAREQLNKLLDGLERDALSTIQRVARARARMMRGPACPTCGTTMRGPEKSENGQLSLWACNTCCLFHDLS